MSLTSQDWIGSLERPLPTALTLIPYLSDLFRVWTFTPADIRGARYGSARLCLGFFHEEMFDGILRYLAVSNSPSFDDSTTAERIGNLSVDVVQTSISCVSGRVATLYERSV